jgi:hypothetical protein
MLRFREWNVVLGKTWWPEVAPFDGKDERGCDCPCSRVLRDVMDLYSDCVSLYPDLMDEGGVANGSGEGSVAVFAGDSMRPSADGAMHVKFLPSWTEAEDVSAALTWGSSSVFTLGISYFSLGSAEGITLG